MEMTNARRISMMLRLVLSLALFVVAAYGADWALRAKNFPVQSVRFEGPFRHVTREQLERATLDVVRGNFFLVDLSAVQRRVEALPWVQQASVRRLFPQVIAISFTEQRLAARWGADAWLNADGEVVHVSGNDLSGDLPRLDGPDGTSAQVYEAFHEFRERLAPLNLRLVGLALSARRSWRLDLQPPEGARPFTIVVDHERALTRLERFVRVYRAAFAHEEDRVRRVDLRYTNGFAVQWYPGEAPARVAHAPPTHNEG
jgi:cell division protein FtsQ